jgi:hypothetical protein
VEQEQEQEEEDEDEWRLTVLTIYRNSMFVHGLSV